MEDFVFQSENLVNVQINNKDNTEEYPLICDFKTTKTPAFQRVFPYFIILFSLLLSLYHPKMSSSSFETVKLSKKNESSVFSLTYQGIKLINQFLDVNIHFKEPTPLNGTVFVSLMKSGNLTDSFNFDFNKKFPKIAHVIRANALKFDTMQLSFIVNDTTNIENVEFVTSDEVFQKMFIAFKCILSLIAIIYIIIFSRNVIELESQTFEQGLTLCLSTLLICFTDVLSFIDLISAGTINVLRKLMLRDVFYCFYLFYICSIFMFFIREPTEVPALSVGIPFALMFCTLMFLLGTSACINFTHNAEFDPLLFGNQAEFNLYETMTYLVFTCLYFYQYFTAKNKVIASSKQRFESYKSLTLPFVVILGITFIINYFIPGNSFTAFVPLGVIVGSTIGLMYAHLSVKEELAVYEKAGENENQLDNDAQGSTLLDDNDEA